MSEAVSAERFFEDWSGERHHRRPRAESSPGEPTAAALFDALVFGSRRLPEQWSEGVEVVGRPGERVADRLRSGDRLVRRAVGEGNLAFVSVLASAEGEPGAAESDSVDGGLRWMPEQAPWDEAVVEGTVPRRRLGPDELIVRVSNRAGARWPSWLADAGRHQPGDAWGEEARPEDDSVIEAAEAAGSDHVRVSLRNADGSPAANVAYRVRFRDGRTVNGTLDANGEATVRDRHSGDVTVTFPGLPSANWEIQSFGDTTS